LSGSFRQNEGELAGALLLFRKAAELYDPEAHDHLGRVQAMITDAELKCHRPLAARAAMKLAIHHDPANAELRQAFDDLFGDKGRVPTSARRELTFQPPPGTSPPERRAAWERALTGAATGKLSDAARAFEQLTNDDQA